MEYWDSERECVSLDAQHDYQLRSMREQLRFVAKASPYYQGSGLPVDVSTLDEFYAAVSPVTKADLIADVAQDPPFGRLLCVSAEELVRIYAHPGPQAFCWTADDRDALVDMYAQGIATAGFGAADTVDVTFQYAWVMAGTIWDSAVQRVGAAAIPGGAGGTSGHLENLRALRVNGLMGFPTYVEEIAAQARERGLDPTTDLVVRKILVIGELRGQDAKDRLRSMYAADFVHEAYGTAEIGLVAAECGRSDGGGMHLHPDVLVEVRDPESGDEVADGVPGELYLTPLRRRAMPVLRYRTGDITEFRQRGPCECGRTTPRIGRILGRASDLFRVKGVFLVPAVVDDVVRSGSGSSPRYQLVISRPAVRDQLRLLVEYGGTDSDALAGVLAAQFKERCRVSIEVECVGEGSLPVEAAKIVDER